MDIIQPIGNTGVLFQTSDISWHGLPKPLQCPNNIYRQSAAIYYVSKPRDNATLRLKALFRPLPGQPITNGLLSLYNIRPIRLITNQDIYDNIGTDCESNNIGHGYWFN